MSKIIVGLLLLVLSTSAAAQLSCGNAIATPDVNACAQKDLDRIELLLNIKYKATLAKLLVNSKDDPSAREARDYLIEAQREWVKYRASDCKAIYTLWSTGTIRNLMYLGCMHSRAAQRIKELGDYGDQDR